MRICSRQRPSRLYFRGTGREDPSHIANTMKSNTSILAAGLSVVFLTGCVDTGPNTQRGAVGGAALGAIAGAIIGNNHGSGNAASGALIGAAAGGLAGGTMGNAADHEQGTIYRSEAEATTNVVMSEPPPAPPPPPRERVVVEERTPPPAPREEVWVAGYWAYAGHGRYSWVEGHWERPPARYRPTLPPTGSVNPPAATGT